MARISRQTREIINIVVFLVVVGALLYFYVIYPLGKSKTLLGRQNLDAYDDDSVLVNDATTYIEAGLAPDTFRVESDGLTTLACLYAAPENDSLPAPRGTVLLVHDEFGDRDSVAGLASLLIDSGFAVIAYDQRSSGRSTGKYHGEGGYEAEDMVALVSYLELREKIVHPLTVVGFSLGGDAALLASLEETRIDRVLAVNPFLSTQRLMVRLTDTHNLLWFPFRKTILWWWYDIRSSYAAPFRTIDDIEPVACPTVLFLPQENIDDQEVVRLKEQSDPELLEIKTPLPDERAILKVIASPVGVD
ncbi:MAG: alpha/beta hydrolase [candidate division Zixibacteria bacterium]|nr:alpha/beta hydrolase [candidate division Zixibacteria bacterium]